ncbi:MAG: copper amine oxidase N-terminal domain-containing protein [Christensenellales bacterium]
MKFKHKLMTAASTALVAAMLPINAFAAVQVDIYGDRRVYGKNTPFDTYVELESTGYGLINNTATIKLTLENGKFVTDSSGNYLPVYITDSKTDLERDDIADGLESGSLEGFGIVPSDEDYVKITLPEKMIDGYAQIMFTATAKEYGDVTLSLSDNRDINYIVQRDDKSDEEKNTAEQVQPTKVVIPIGSQVIYIGDETYKLDVPPYITNDVTKLPLRAISDIFKADIYWNGAEKSIDIEVGEDKIHMAVGNKKMYVNGYAVPLSAAPEISDGRAFVPLRDMAQIFGIDDIKWDGESKTVSFELKDYSGHSYLIYDNYKRL